MLSCVRWLRNQLFSHRWFVCCRAALTAAVAAVAEPEKADVGSWPKEDSPEETDASDLVGAAQKEKAQQRSPKGKRKPPKPKGPKPTKSDPARGPGLMLPGRAERNELFDRCDVHSNGALSLSEVEQSVAELWPRFDAKPTLMRYVLSALPLLLNFPCRGSVADHGCRTGHTRRRTRTARG